jgi:hypothetical protein
MFATMAKKEPDPQPADRHKNKVLSLRPPAAVRAQLDALAKAERRSNAQMALILVEEALAARAQRGGRP